MRAGIAVALLAALAAGCGTHAPVVPPSAAVSASSAAARGGAAAEDASSSLVPAPANPAFASVLPLLRGAGPTVYLPAWLPAPAAGQAFDLTGQADATSYQVSIAEGAAPAAAQDLPDAPQAAQIAALAGGAPAALPAAPSFQPLSGGGQAVALGGGLQATYYAQPQSGTFSLLQWQQEGWTFQVADVTGLGAGAAALTTYARALASAVPAGQTPVPGVGSGDVVQTLDADGAPTWVLWQQGQWSYQLEASNGPALPIAASMTRVAP